MMKSKNLWLLAVPTAFLALAGCGGGSDNGPSVPTPTPTPTIPSGVNYNNIGTFSAISGNSNVDKSQFQANQSGVLRSNGNSAVLTLTDQDSIIQSRRFRITGPFSPSTVGQSISLAASGGDGVATVIYEQNDGGTLSRWQANSGTVIIDQFTPSNTVGVDATVRFRLLNATFVPSTATEDGLDKGAATGTFAFNVNGAIS